MRCHHGLDPDDCAACFDWGRDDTHDCHCCDCGAPIRENWARDTVACGECGHLAKDSGELCRRCQENEVCSRCDAQNGNHRHWCALRAYSRHYETTGD